MLKSWRLLTIAVLAVVVAILTVDWAMARARLPGIVIETTLETSELIADGRHTATFVVRVTEDGQPRAGDLLQLWLVQGSGQLVPQWAFTDDQGTTRISFTPVPYNRYDPQDAVEIEIMDTNIGRLIEVGKHSQIQIPLVLPTEP
jgi:anti-sigma-K factor RskA